MASPASPGWGVVSGEAGEGDRGDAQRRSSAAGQSDGTVDEFIRVQPGAEPPPEEQPGDGRRGAGGPWMQDPWTTRQWGQDQWQWGDWQGFWQWEGPSSNTSPGLDGWQLSPRGLEHFGHLGRRETSDGDEEDRSKGAVRGHSEARGE